MNYFCSSPKSWPAFFLFAFLGNFLSAYVEYLPLTAAPDAQASDVTVYGKVCNNQVNLLDQDLTTLKDVGIEALICVDALDHSKFISIRLYEESPSFNLPLDSRALSKDRLTLLPRGNNELPETFVDLTAPKIAYRFLSNTIQN